MDTLSSLDRDCSAIAGLFQIIVNDLKNSGPMWEDFLTKASKLQHALKITLVAFSSFLDAFQRIADSATNTRGATKDVGAALTRLSLRHRAIESRIKGLTSAIMECLVNPLQEKLDEWRRTNHSLDKEHTKEYKRARSDIKKRTEHALRLQKKAKKVCKNADLNKAVETSIEDLVVRYGTLEENERTALRHVMTEERSRYCTFAVALKPVLEEEVGLVSELSYIQEVISQLERHSSDPLSLPPASEQVLKDIKSGDTKWSWQTPPSSPTSSLGSRKSSMCSISSINSSSSSSTQSPSHHVRPRSVSQVHRMWNGLSQDSGFTSQDTLNRPTQAVCFGYKQNSGLSVSSASDGSHTPSPAAPTTATWPNLTDLSLQHKSASATGLHTLIDRPHTISSAYERGKDRLPLTVYTFQHPDSLSGPSSPQISSQPVSPVHYEFESGNISPVVGHMATISRKSSRTSLQYAMSSSSQESLNNVNKAKPPVPMRCSSLERPSIPEKKPGVRHLQQQQLLQQLQQKEQLQQQELMKQSYQQYDPSLLTTDDNGLVPDYNRTAPDMVLPQPLYSNMAELQSEFVSAPQVISGKETTESDGSSSHASLGSSGYGSQPNMAIDHLSRLEGYIMARNGSLRRGQKPPPPVRRTSSISSTSSLATSSYPIGSLTGSFSNSSLNSSTSTVLSSPITGNNGKSINGIFSGNNSSSPSQSSSNDGSSNASPLQRTDSESSTPVGSMENLPPPPAFLLENPTAVDNAFSSHDPDMTTPEGILCLSGSLISSHNIKDECLQQRKLSVSETVKCLQESRHQPPSPVTYRRSQSPRMSVPALAIRQPVASFHEERRASLENTRAALISSLNSKLAVSNPVLGSVPRQNSPLQQAFSGYPNLQQTSVPQCHKINLSPKLQRLRLSSVQEDVSSSNNSDYKLRSPLVGPRPQQKHMLSAGSATNVLPTQQAQPKFRHMEIDHGIKKKQVVNQPSFIQNLNMVLAQRPPQPTIPESSTPVGSSPRSKHRKRAVQGQSNGSASTAIVQRSSSTASEKASKMRQWMSSKKAASSEVTSTSLRESLLDQIRRGTQLRKPKIIADRSAPRVH